MRTLLVLTFALSIVSFTAISLSSRGLAVVAAPESRSSLAPRPTVVSPAAADAREASIARHAILMPVASTSMAGGTAFDDSNRAVRGREAGASVASRPLALPGSDRDAAPSSALAALLEVPFTAPAPVGSASLLPLPLGVELVWTRAHCASPPHADAAHRSRVDDALCALLPETDLASRPAARSCAVVGSSGALLRSGYGPFIDAHEEVFRFNGAPAGPPWERDAGSKTTVAILADVQTRLCASDRASRPTMRPPQGPETTWQHTLEPVRGCEFYARTPAPISIVFIPRKNGASQILRYAAKEAAVGSASALGRSGAAPTMRVRADSFAAHVDSQIDAYANGTSHPTSGFNGVVAALALCASVDLYGFGTPREHYFTEWRTERKGAQHLYRTEYAWYVDLERRFPGRVRVWR